ncbi:lysophospholipase L1-like esterase [Kutzneria viridogrisea]|uniref:Lysophospholipase L1-like esterase n=1 Tax=Kutzneria viridogrisea TaxID=47990 RepID=A0ABR6BTE6_9PSEU|nr:lysophospholipase L1-like esterase [Kutzneria viridogrisea]
MAVHGFRRAAVALGALGGLSGALYQLMLVQAKKAEQVIGIPVDPPFLGDGMYLPDGRGPLPVLEVDRAPLRFAVFGDSMAAGLGVDGPEQLPGVLLARELAEESGRPVWLDTHAVVGATTRDLAAQVDRALAGRPPDVALIIIGANDVTVQLPIPQSVAKLVRELGRLRQAGTGVVVGTCPDLGTVRPLAQPLRSYARTWSLLLSRAQCRAVAKAGALAVPLADLLAPDFLTRPAELFSSDQFHPSAAGYEQAASVLLPALCSVAGVWTGGPLPSLPTRSQLAESRRPTARLIARVNRGLGRA